VPVTRGASANTVRSTPSGVRAFKPPPAPRTPKSTRTRARLLDLAATMFVERGYFAVSVRDIAEAAGLTNGAVYGHFRSKGQLLVEVVRWKLSEYDAATDFAAASDPMVGVQLMYDKRGRAVRVLQVDAASAARHDPEVRAGLAWLYSQRLERIRDTMGDSARDADAAAWLLATISAGIGMRESAGLPSPDDTRRRDVLLSAMSGLRDPNWTGEEEGSPRRRRGR
jgi:AcrR family transcriptional regulator